MAGENSNKKPVREITLSDIEIKLEDDRTVLAPNDFERDEPTDPGLIVPPPPPARAASAARAPLAPVPTPAAAPPSTTPPPESTNAAAPPIRMPELGAIAALMRNPKITEIMVNDLRNVVVESEGRLMLARNRFESIDELNRVVRNILDFTGRILSADQPYVDGILPDGSRVNIVIPPLTQNGPCITIRKFPKEKLTMRQLLQTGMFDERIGEFLQACVAGRLNILVCGGTGTGKTTLLNALCDAIPQTERLVAIEDTPELVLTQVNSVKLQTKPQMPASPPITARELVANALRMRPDRIIIGECRRSEAFDMLQAMNTGHAGSMTTLHANSPRDGLARLETLCLMADVALPLHAIRRQMHSALDLIVQIQRYRSGKRRLSQIAEVTGMEGDTITLQDLFAYELPPKASGDIEHGRFRATGFVPTFLERLREQGVALPDGFFG